MIIVDVVMMLRDLIFRFAAFDVLSSGRSHERNYYIVRNTRLQTLFYTQVQKPKEKLTEIVKQQTSNKS